MTQDNGRGGDAMRAKWGQAIKAIRAQPGIEF